MLENNYHLILRNISQSAQNSGRDPKKIKLIVVSKAQPIEKIKEAIALGIEDFGENYPEETKIKISNLKNIGDNIRWHMIGHLQSRKAPIICEHFHFMHTIDSLHICQVLDPRLSIKEKKLDCLIEVNISGESSKNGFAAWDEPSIELFLVNVAEIIEFPNLIIKGLMTMPPLFKNPEDARHLFRRMQNIQSMLKIKYPENCWDELSMGTTLDYKVAIEEGATMVRIGQALFGPRE